MIIWINQHLKEYVIVVAQLRLVNFPLWRAAIKRGAFVASVGHLMLLMNGGERMSEDETACKHENVTVVYGITYCDDCHLTLYKGGEEE